MPKKSSRVCQDVPAENGNSESFSPGVVNPKYKYDFVLNNYTEDEVCQLKVQLPKICKKVVVGKEVGEQGTPHLQGYMWLIKKQRYTTLHNISGLARASFREIRNEPAAIEYMQKDGDIIIRHGFPYEYKKVTFDMLREDQKEIAKIFEVPEHPLNGRKIYWYWESEGNWGKSFLATYFIDQLGAIEVSGANNDILYGIANFITTNNGRCAPIVIFDLPRSVEAISYQAIEKIKNGKFFSPKYESGMVRFDRPHVIVFANRPPEDLEKLSTDRWVITELKSEKIEFTMDDVLNAYPDVDI